MDHDDLFVLWIGTEEKKSITDLLTISPQPSVPEGSLHQEQTKGLKLPVLINYLENGVLFTEEKKTRETAALATKFVILDELLYFIDQEKTHCCVKTPPRSIATGVPQRENSWRFSGD